MHLLNEFINAVTGAPKDHPHAQVISDSLDKINVFIIDPKLIKLPEADVEMNLAPPFQTCWFQCPEQTKEKIGRIELQGKPYLGLYLHEQNDQLIYCHVTANRKNKILEYYHGTISCISDRGDARAIASWLNALDHSSVGFMKSNERFKYKNQLTKEKRLIKIKEVVMVYPKKLSAEQKLYAETHKIQFSHRFAVRGHWRHIQGIGKNRQGEYCIDGKTYVHEFEKGPKKAPLIRKTRVARFIEQN